MTFASHLQKTMNATAVTENGAVSNLTTNSALLDLFSQIGAMRTGGGAGNRIAQFNRAVSEDNLLAMKILFHARDVRGGSQERETFRIFFKNLVTTNPNLVAKNLHLVPEFGRWDDLWCLLDTQFKNQVIDLIKSQLVNDAKSEKPSLLAKWLPSENTSSSATRKLASVIRISLNLSPRDYRKVLSDLRSKINIVEKMMSTNKWENINYEHVPSKAAMKYRKAFGKHDQERYGAYITAVINGEKKIKAGTLFPYEIVGKFLQSAKDDPTAEALWKNLPNYFGDNSDDSLVVADVSGSMCGIPMQVSISLAMYIAERNKGVWNNKFITFSTNPVFNMLNGKTLRERVFNLHRADWHQSTNIERVFDLILKTAQDNNLKNNEIVKRIFIISDMEFNAASGGANHSTLFRVISDKYKSAGYTLPTLVFWNVRSAREQFPMSLDDTNFQMVSGCSPSILQYMFTNVRESAYEKMLTVLNSERYSTITV